jgi:hypothetical protein
MELLRDEGHVESHFSPFGCKIGAQFAPNVPLAQKTLWTHPMGLLVTRLKWKLDSVRLNIVLILTQDRCMVCVEHTKGSQIVLDAPDGTPR